MDLNYLNKTNKRIITEKLLLMRKLQCSSLDRVGRHHTQKQIKQLARKVYRLEKAIDIILENL